VSGLPHPLWIRRSLVVKGQARERLESPRDMSPCCSRGTRNAPTRISPLRILDDDFEQRDVSLTRRDDFDGLTIYLEVVFSSEPVGHGSGAEGTLNGDEPSVRGLNREAELYRLPVRLDGRSLPMDLVDALLVHEVQEAQVGRVRSPPHRESRAVATMLGRTRYDRVVADLGGHGEHATRADDLRPALDRAFASGRPALVNVEMGASAFRPGAISV